MSNPKDLKKENDRLARELADACLEIVDTRIAYKKLLEQTNSLEAALILHLIQHGSTALEAQKFVDNVILKKETQSSPAEIN